MASQITSVLTLNVRGPSYLGWLGQCHGRWCPGSLRRLDISSHDIDYVEYVSPGLTWGRILSACVISMWSNDIKCKYMFMFPLENLSRKGLINCLPNRSLRCRSKQISKLRVTGLCEGNPPVTGRFPPQRVINAENVSIWWPHHGPGISKTKSVKHTLYRVRKNILNHLLLMTPHASMNLVNTDLGDPIKSPVTPTPETFRGLDMARNARFVQIISLYIFKVWRTCPHSITMTS